MPLIAEPVDAEVDAERTAFSRKSLAARICRADCSGNYRTAAPARAGCQALGGSAHRIADRRRDPARWRRTKRAAVIATSSSARSRSQACAGSASPMRALASSWCRRQYRPAKIRLSSPEPAITSPNSFQVSPSNFISCILLDRGEIGGAGRDIDPPEAAWAASRSLMDVRGFFHLTFSRVRLSPLPLSGPRP